MGLKRISALETYDFPAYAYDVTGWAVRTQLDGKKVGRVDDLVVAADGEPRYLDVDLGFLKKHVLVPLEYAQADAVEEVVVVERMSAPDFETVPPLTHDMSELTLDYERRLSEAYRAPGAHALDRPAVPDDAADNRFVRLEGMEGFRIKGDADPRGWKVIAGDGSVLGRAVDLLVDRDSMRAAYLLASVDEKGHGLERIGRHVLIPIERVRLTDNKRVLVDGLFARDLGRYPVYGGLPIRADVIDRIGAFFEGLIGADAAVSDVGARRTYDAGPTRHPRVFFGTSAPPRIDRTGETPRDIDEERGALVVDRDVDGDHEILARDRDVLARRDPTDPTPEAVTVHSGDREIRIRLRGDDIVIERLPAEEVVREPDRAVEPEPEPPLP
jgi:sporulation protein YlmC with PRC-barrel domain